MKTRIFVFLIMMMTLLSCRPSKALSPEQAVVAKLLRNGKINANSIQVLPAVQLHDSYFVFTGYNFFPANGKTQEPGQKCTSLFEVVRATSDWEVFGHGAGCSSNPYTDVFGTHTGVNFDFAQRGGTFSFAGGETVIADAVWVEVHWDDGTLQRVPVDGEHFIALRDGNHMPQVYVVLDKNSEETYTWKDSEDTEVIDLTP